MIIQGTVGTGKYFLINCLKDLFLANSTSREIPLLLFAPTGVANFQINALTIHSTLHIYVSSMQPLEGESLLNLQEQLQYVKSFSLMK